MKFQVQVFRRVSEAQLVTVEAEDARKARRRALRLSRGQAEPGKGEDVNEFCDGIELRGRTIGRVERLP